MKRLWNGKCGYIGVDSGVANCNTGANNGNYQRSATQYNPGFVCGKRLGDAIEPSYAGLMIASCDKVIPPPSLVILPPSLVNNPPSLVNNPPSLVNIPPPL